MSPKRKNPPFLIRPVSKVPLQLAITAQRNMGIQKTEEGWCVGHWKLFGPDRACDRRSESTKRCNGERRPFMSRSTVSMDFSTVRYEFIKIRMKVVNFIKNHFHQNHFHQKPLSSKTTFIKNHFHQKPLSSKTTFIKNHFHQKPLSSKTTLQT